MRAAEKLYRKWGSQHDERAYAEVLLEISRGHWADMIPGMPAEPSWHSDPSYRQSFAPNFLDLALRELNYLYDRSPHRQMMSEPEQAWAQDRVWSYGTGLDSAMSAADRYARLHGECLLYGIYRDSPDAPSELRRSLATGAQPTRGEEAGIEWVAIPRPHYAVMLNEMDPRFIEACLIYVGDCDAGPKHLYWDSEHFAFLIGGEPQPLNELGDLYEEHGFGAIPVVRVLNSADWYEARKPCGLGGADLITNLQAVGGLLREYGWTAKLQRGQPWASGEIKNLVLAPDAVVVVDQGSTFGIAANNADLAGQQGAIMLHLELLTRTMGLPANTFRIDRSAEQSGVAIVMERAVLEDDRRGREVVFRGIERRVHRISGGIWTAYQGPISGELASITYRPWQQIQTDQDIQARVFGLLDRGKIATHDALRELYPDESAEQIDERIQRLRDEEAEARSIKVQMGAVEAEQQARVAAAAIPPDPFAGLLGGGESVVEVEDETEEV